MSVMVIGAIKVTPVAIKVTPRAIALLCFACAHPLVGAFDGARPVAAVCWTRSEIFLPRGGIVSVTASQGVSAVHFKSPVHVFFPDEGVSGFEKMGLL